ncbi:MAG: Bax inhibitor-1/YccA family protein [Bacteroides sp.]|nr:Bax inhibitor-1/YccA family protein [Roseburia sp.]MCM1347343.1 Bax inhibitor-1/YccA family protein [Bacteroides sp.]MCM1421841.1 Bax inhibitor-1/YccA family protein [Bacteroides sp.]
MENNLYSRDYSYSHSYDVTAAFSVLMKNVYVWMTMALAVTGLTAYYVATSPELLYAVLSTKFMLWGLLIAELAIVMILTSCIRKLSFPVAALMMAAYSVLTGVSLSVIFIAYTLTSIASTFFITAGTFAAMAVVGYTTNKDLTKFGGILFMALIGLVIAVVVNMFLASTMMDYIISGFGVLLFTGLTAYDANKIKAMLMQCDTVDGNSQKMALLGSLTLYLDFINLFLYLLRFLGNRK